MVAPLMPRARRPVDQQPVRLTLQLSPELTARVLRYHADSGLPGRPQDAARELIMAALDYPEVESSLLLSARRRGFYSVRQNLLDFMQAEVAQLEREWERLRKQVGDDEGVGDGGRGVEQQQRFTG